MWEFREPLSFVVARRQGRYKQTMYRNAGNPPSVLAERVDSPVLGSWLQLSKHRPE